MPLMQKPVRDNMKNNRFVFMNYYYGVLLWFMITSACCNQVQSRPTETPKTCILLVYLIFLFSTFPASQIRNSPTFYCFSIDLYFSRILHAYLVISALICDTSTTVCKSVPFFIIFWHSSSIICFLLAYFSWFTPFLLFTPLLASATSQFLLSHHERCPAVSHSYLVSLTSGQAGCLPACWNNHVCSVAFEKGRHYGLYLSQLLQDKLSIPVAVRPWQQYCL